MWIQDTTVRPNKTTTTTKLKCYTATFVENEKINKKHVGTDWRFTSQKEPVGKCERLKTERKAWPSCQVECIIWQDLTASSGFPVGNPLQVIMIMQGEDVSMLAVEAAGICQRRGILWRCCQEDWLCVEHEIRRWVTTPTSVGRFIWRAVSIYKLGDLHGS